MNVSPRRTFWRCTLLSALLVACPIHAQVMRGVVRSQTTSRVIERARLTAQDRAGRVVGEATSDDEGRFVLRLDGSGQPFVVTVRRIGVEPSTTAEFTLTPADTVAYEFSIPEKSVMGDTVRVMGMASFNDSKYREALRRGWKVFSPEEVAIHRDKAGNVYDLLRWAGASSLVIPTRPTECVKSARYIAGDRRSDRCMVWIVDGVVLGPTPVLNPSDTYFMAILTASESAVQFGDKAPWGAIVLYTRMNGDRLRP